MQSSRKSACGIRMMAASFGCAFAAWAAPALATSTPQLLPTVHVVATVQPAAAGPSVSVRATRKQLSRQNIADSADVLRYFPNLQVRQRYIGDPNAIVSGRNAGTLQSARTLVYADGLLLSNLMTNGWNGAPRWGMVPTEAITAVKVLYGTYSALYPGNAIGNTVLITTRLPNHFMASAHAQYFSQDFRDDYGTSGHYDGYQAGALLGDRHGRWRWLLAVNRLDNHGQPMEYATAKRAGDPAGARPVTGAAPDRNPDGRMRLVYGARDMQHTRQNRATLQVGLQINADLEARIFLGGWRERASDTTRTFLRDAAGNPVYAGSVLVDGEAWTLPVAGLAPASANRSHVLYGAQVDGCHDNGWCWKAIASRFDFAHDTRRTAVSSSAMNGQAGPGKLADMHGSGWETFDLRSSGPLGENNVLFAGVHFDRYQLDSRVHDIANWQGGSRGSLASAYAGRTSTRAAYLQDIWTLAPRWALTLGLRWEQWRAYAGRLANATTSVAYPARRRSDFSPKASLAWQFAPRWELRASFGKAVRYPTVEELFQGSLSNQTIVNNDPELAPERDWSTDVSLTRHLQRGHWRVSLFQDRFADTLYKQTDVTLPVPVTSVQNIAGVRVRGVEAALNIRDVLPEVDLETSIAWNDAVTLHDAQYPLADGKRFPRIPRLRASVFVDWRFAPRWDMSFGLRHSGRQYGKLDNSDFIDSYGAISRFTVADAKLRWRFAPQWTASLGVNNLTNARYWVYHPYAGRTWFGEIRWNLDSES